jgi:outer membrane protein TolC
MTKGMRLLPTKMARSSAAISPLETPHPYPPAPSRQIQPPRFLRLLAALQGVWLLMVLVIAASAPLGLNPAAARAAEESGQADTKKLVDFPEAVRIALKQSPYFTKSALDIDLSRLDESDSRHALLPSVSFRTRYYVNRPHNNNLNLITLPTNPPVVVNQSNAVPQAYSLEFYTDSYNPLEAYFSLQARKLLTKIAKFTHLQVIADGIQRLGRMFLDMQSLKQLTDYQKEINDLSRKNLEYIENRARLGTATSLEVRVARQELEVAQAEAKRLESSQKRARENLKSFLGLKPSEEISLDLHDVRRQILGGFDPNTATLDQAKARSWELKIKDIKKQLQTYNITVAKTRLLPSFIAGIQNPDPLSLTAGGGNNLFFSVGLQLPVWDGLRRVRNISRQKVLLKQYDAEKALKEMDLSDVWETAQGDIQEAASALKLSQSQEELARLKERQADISYQSGSIQLPDYLEGRKAVLEAKKTTVTKAMDYHAAVLRLRFISGDLDHSYVDQSSWQN